MNSIILHEPGMEFLATTERFVAFHPTITKVTLVTAKTRHPRARVQCHEMILSFSTSFPMRIYYFYTFYSLSLNQRIVLLHSRVLKHPNCVSMSISTLTIIYPFFFYYSPRPRGSCQKLLDGYLTHSFIDS
jgi:hypothetical protein